MVKRFVIVFVLLLIVCGGLVGFNLFRDKAIADFFANMPAPVVTISAAEVKPTDWQPGIEAIGTAKANQGVDIAVEVGGIVGQILFKANERVEAGQLLGKIVDDIERADLLSARSAVERDRLQLKRVEDLRRRGAASEAALDEARASLAASQSSLERVTALVQQKAIEAPFAGTIGIPRVDPGAYVQPGQVIATLQNTDVMKIDFTVPEQRVSALSIGQTARFGAEAGSLDFEGRIVGIEPKTDPSTRLVTVRAEVQNRDDLIRPGQFIRVRVDLPEEKGIVAIPQTAVVASLYGDYVYLIQETPPKDGAKDGKKVLTARQSFVTAGRRNGNLIEIVKGLEPGQTIVTSGQNKLDNGTVVAIDNSVDPAVVNAAAR